ncbi:hypothetical protein BLNAU_21286 [Blattamonas nauphoetae]|uniref:ISXO2-like transposase domain-containing protein n=1 Tax=Blattamonas nauphoetae TaxID=2049346 RepID=A0ABQ9WWD2_9EUKA|nr:hypothetical protein BLNAU_21286 [Blattamonas nauphoetae]
MDLLASIYKSLVQTVNSLRTTKQERNDAKENIDLTQTEAIVVDDEQSGRDVEAEPVPERVEATPAEKLPADTLVLLPISPPAPALKLMDGDEFEKRVGTPEGAILFAQECGLLPSTAVCPECGKTMTKNKKNRPGSESSIFTCENKYPRVRISSFWKNDSMAVLQADCGIAKEAAVKWRRICRLVCCIALQKRVKKIGGPGKTVEVDEAHMIRSKGRRGKGRTGYWMVGGCEVGNPSAYFVEMVASRDRATLEEVCERRIKKGTEIVTDMWKGYGFADTKKVFSFS